MQCNNSTHVQMEDTDLNGTLLFGQLNTTFILTQITKMSPKEYCMQPYIMYVRTGAVVREQSLESNPRYFTCLFQ